MAKNEKIFKYAISTGESGITAGIYGIVCQRFRFDSQSSVGPIMKSWRWRHTRLGVLIINSINVRHLCWIWRYKHYLHTYVYIKSASQVRAICWPDISLREKSREWGVKRVEAKWFKKARHSEICWQVGDQLGGTQIHTCFQVRVLLANLKDAWEALPPAQGNLRRVKADAVTLTRP